VTKVARPPLSLAVPKAVVPSRNVTVPVAAVGVTVAIKVTGCPKEDGLGEAERLVVVPVVVAPVPVTNMVTPGWLATPATVIASGTDPEPVLPGTRRFTCSIPTVAGTRPAKITAAGCPSIVAVTGWERAERGEVGAATPSTPGGVV